MSIFSHHTLTPGGRSSPSTLWVPAWATTQQPWGPGRLHTRSPSCSEACREHWWWLSPGHFSSHPAYILHSRGSPRHMSAQQSPCLNLISLAVPKASGHPLVTPTGLAHPAMGRGPPRPLMHAQDHMVENAMVLDTQHMRPGLAREGRPGGRQVSCAVGRIRLGSVWGLCCLGIKVGTDVVKSSHLMGWWPWPDQ